MKSLNTRVRPVASALGLILSVPFVAGAEMPKAPCRNPAKNPIGKFNLCAIGIDSCHFGL